jgi:putative N6-adenine-specific DNA methylase
LKALNIAPGINRHFSAERWQMSNPKVWKDERTRAIDLVNKSATFEAYGYDIDPEAVELTLSNVAKVGIKTRIHVKQGDVANFKPIQDSITICNPPYGERLLEIKQAEELYTIMGEHFGKGGSNPSYIISPHEDFENFFGKKADRRRKLYNGMIKCQLFMYFK